ncbi:hypothetical protein GCM10027348_34440 [Hymenobacter tenuis]
MLVAWAGWNKLRFGNDARAVQMLQLQVAGLQDPVQAATVQKQLSGLPGVAACVIDGKTQVATVHFHKEDITAEEIERVLSVGGVFKVTRPAPAPGIAPGHD